MTADCRRQSNLQCFLDCITPTVETHILPKSLFHSTNTICERVETHTVEYFSLSDLWEQYYEASAYGAGTPVQFPNGKSVIQYFAPYLSAIQLYTTKVFASSRSFGRESVTDYWGDETGIENYEKLRRSRSTLSDDSVFRYEGACSPHKRLERLYFEFFETGSPYGRIPLVDKVYELAQNFPGLTSLKSVELSPASWMSVAWYPIYHIPNQHNVKELSACFLTYHTISSSFQDYTLENDANGFYPTANGKRSRTQSEDNSDGVSHGVSLPPFGLAAHKIQGSLWTNSEAGDHERITSLFNAAASWLKQLRVQHHDFNFFITHSP